MNTRCCGDQSISKGWSISLLFDDHGESPTLIGHGCIDGQDTIIEALYQIVLQPAFDDLTLRSLRHRFNARPHFFNRHHAQENVFPCNAPQPSRDVWIRMGLGSLRDNVRVEKILQNLAFRGLLFSRGKSTSKNSPDEGRNASHALTNGFSTTEDACSLCLIHCSLVET